MQLWSWFQVQHAIRISGSKEPLVFQFRVHFRPVCQKTESTRTVAAFCKVAIWLGGHCGAWIATTTIARQPPQKDENFMGAAEKAYPSRREIIIGVRRVQVLILQIHRNSGLWRALWNMRKLQMACRKFCSQTLSSHTKEAKNQGRNRQPTQETPTSRKASTLTYLCNLFPFSNNTTNTFNA